MEDDMQPADRRYGADSDDSPFRDTGRRPPRPRAPEHMPVRPSWDCSTCGQPYPCPPARAALAVEYASSFTGLSMLMWDLLEEYSRDVGPGPLTDAYQRFMGWARELREETL